jgi:hypothetical protein
MRLLRLTSVAFVITFTAMWAVETIRAADPPEKSTRIERVLVIGQRLGNLRALLAGSTLRGTEGFVDGSAPEESDNRTSFPWQVYYGPDGKLEAHFRRIGARTPHGTMEELDYVEYGTWTIDEGELCQTIPRVGSGSTVCFELRRVGGTKIQMYYTRCGAMNRCYPGRLGPDGELFPGRSFTR